MARCAAVAPAPVVVAFTVPAMVTALRVAKLPTLTTSPAPTVTFSSATVVPSVMCRVPPLAPRMVPFLIFPVDSSRHTPPPVPSMVSVPPPRSSVPATRTVPPVVWSPAKSARVKLPVKVSVPPETAMSPAFDQAPARVIVPALTRIAPSFVTIAAVVNVPPAASHTPVPALRYALPGEKSENSTCPALGAVIVPSFTHVPVTPPGM
jgi:hypothetical protein